MTEEATIPQGYKHYRGVSPAEDNVGPFYYRKEGDVLHLGMRAEAKHANGMGSVHGGVLLCFADYAATMLALSGVKENCVTISLTSDFLAAARIGDWIEGSGEVIKRTGSMTFIRGQLVVEGEPVLSFQTVLRRLKKPS
ncbi:MAG: PaaI family thioesterase [Halioglobus sp.]